MPIFNIMKRNRAELQVQVMIMNAANETCAATYKSIVETFRSYQLFTVLWQAVMYTPYLFLLQISCFITVLLSTTRMIAMVKPLYIIRQKMVFSAFAISTTFLFNASDHLTLIATLKITFTNLFSDNLTCSLSAVFR